MIRSAKILELRDTLMKSSTYPRHLAITSSSTPSQLSTTAGATSTTTPKRTPRVTFVSDAAPGEASLKTPPPATAPPPPPLTASKSVGSNFSGVSNHEEGYVSWSEASSGKNSPVKSSPASTSRYPSLTPDEAVSIPASTPIPRKGGGGGGGGGDKSMMRRASEAPKLKIPSAKQKPMKSGTIMNSNQSPNTPHSLGNRDTRDDNAPACIQSKTTYVG